MNLDYVPLAGNPDGVAVVDLSLLDREEDMERDLSRLHLSRRELPLYSSFSHTGRRRHWLGGRLAARRAMQNSGHGVVDGYLAGLDILPDLHGRPWFFSGELRLPVFLSISHSAERAAALLATAPCGIDIQEINPTARRVRERFLSAAEEHLLATEAGDGLDEILRAALMWTAKEALRKSFVVHPLPWFNAFVLTWARQEQGIFFLRFTHEVKSTAYVPTVTVVAERLNGYFLARIVHRPQSTDA